MEKDFVSIIVPCRNEVKYIGEAIDSALSSDYPKDKMEILVMDGMSDDGTRELLQQISYPGVRVIDNVARTTPFAFNIGIKESKGEFILILGARVILSPNYIRECVSVMRQKADVYCVGNGNCENLYDNEEGRIIAKATDSSLALGFGNPRKISREGYADNCDTQLYRKETFTIVGLFDETLTRNQDDEFNYRLQKAGLKIYVTDKISIRYYVRSAFNKLFKQYHQYGYWKIFVNKKHKSITTIRQLVPMLFLLYLVGGLFLSLLFPKIFLPYLSVILFYLLLTFAEGLRIGRSLTEAFRIQYAFINFHFGYAFGYWNGIIDFLLLNKQPDEKSKKLTR